jgi:hypothetical protein
MVYHILPNFKLKMKNPLCFDAKGVLLSVPYHPKQSALLVLAPCRNG